MRSEDLHDWLRKSNLRYRQHNIAPRQRPLEAIRELSQESGHCIEMTSDIGVFIFKWFENETQPDALRFGNLFVGAYFFDSSFFPVTIPISFGSNPTDPFKALSGMPEQMKADLMRNREEAELYCRTWLDCRDYAHNYDGLSSLKPTHSKSRDFLRNGRTALDTVVTQLLAHRVNSGALLGARMVIEIHLKAFLIEKGGKDDAFLKKKIGHDLESAMDACFNITAIPRLVPLRFKLQMFPRIEERYVGLDRANPELWEAYRLAQEIATTILELLSR